MKTGVLGFSSQPFDRRDLSVVVQGNLSRDTLVPTAVRCRHWREIFPDAEIILSLSGADVIGGALSDGVLTDPRLIASLQTDTHLVAALDAIVESCDMLGLRTDGLPLPPIKSDAAKPNNVNLQIAAAQNGLRHATRGFVLRVRSDLVFLDDGFIDQWQAMAALPRGERATLSQRVMISWLYTLNPFTLERFPLHFSDWFHFGQIDDVRALWDVPFVSLADAVYFQAHPHPPGASFGERMFNSRVAVEQHLILEAMRKRIPSLTLDFLTDQSCVDLALDILADDFCLCDLSAAKCVFDKYGAELFNPEKRTHCLTPDDWRLMVQNRGVPYRTTLAHKTREVRDRRAFERDEGFPRFYPASRLLTKVGRHINGEIAAIERNGTLVFGPHVAMPPGQFCAHIEATTLEGPGVLVLRATLDHGRQVLAERFILVETGKIPELSLEFEVTQPNAGDFEIVVDMKDLHNVAIAGIRLVERSGSPALIRFPLRLPSADPSKNIGAVEAQERVGAAPAVWQAVGLWDGARPGRYDASLNVHACEGVGAIFIRASMADGKQVLSEQSLTVHTGMRIDARLNFSVEKVNAGPIGIECRASGLSRLEVRSVTVVECPPSESGATYPRFFRASQLHTQEGVFRNEEIVFTRRAGKVSYGPYISLPPGEYIATFLLSRFTGRGRLSVAVTADVGSRSIAQSMMVLSERSDMRPCIRFSVGSSGATEVEVVCSARGLQEIALTGLLINKLS